MPESARPAPGPEIPEKALFMTKKQRCPEIFASYRRMTEPATHRHGAANAPGWARSAKSIFMGPLQRKMLACRERHQRHGDQGSINARLK
jgi:hypothetical protein